MMTVQEAWKIVLKVGNSIEQLRDDNDYLLNRLTAGGDAATLWIDRMTAHSMDTIKALENLLTVVKGENGCPNTPTAVSCPRIDASDRKRKTPTSRDSSTT